jgi:hypothetical protein
MIIIISSLRKKRKKEAPCKKNSTYMKRIKSNGRIIIAT